MNDVAALQKAREILAKLPVRQVATASRKLYVETFIRLWKSAPIDLLRGNPSRDTYGVRRAAFHFVARKLLVRLITAIETAETKGDRHRMEARLSDLQAFISRIERPLEQHPPVLGEPDFRVASPWQSIPGPRPVRGAASKKHDLRHLPDGWREQVWQQMRGKFKDVCAALCLCPARPAEYLDVRDDGKPGGILVIRQGDTLVFTSRPVKSHRGRYGTGRSIIAVDIVRGGAPAQHLAELCDRSDGKIMLTVSSADALRKSVARAGARAKMPCGISPYTFRHQAIADAKATFGAGAAVASGAGHSSLQSQSRYGRVEHGRSGGGGLIATRAEQPPREPKVPDGERLGELKERTRNSGPVLR